MTGKDDVKSVQQWVAAASKLKSGQVHVFPNENLILATKACHKSWLELDWQAAQGTTWFLLDAGGEQSQPVAGCRVWKYISHVFCGVALC